MRKEIAVMSSVHGAKSLGDEHLNPLTDELVTFPAEEGFGLAVNDDNSTIGSHYDRGVGR
jgi:hypothetical protein